MPVVNRHLFFNTKPLFTMINKLDSLTDIANEFSTPLTSAQNMSWYYNNKNQYSEVQPVMGGGE